jgi:hypothetical protein
VRVLVDGWGARHYLTDALKAFLADGGVDLMSYRPEIKPWDFRSNRLRGCTASCARSMDASRSWAAST